MRSLYSAGLQAVFVMTLTSTLHADAFFAKTRTSLTHSAFDKRIEALRALQDPFAILDELLVTGFFGPVGQPEMEDFMSDTPLGRAFSAGGTELLQKEAAVKEAAAAKAATMEATKASAKTSRGATATSRGAGARTTSGDPEMMHGEAATTGAPLPSYSYWVQSSSVFEGGETKTTISKRYRDSQGRDKSYVERIIQPEGAPPMFESRLVDGNTEKTTVSGVGDVESFDALWEGARPKPALGPGESQ